AVEEAFVVRRRDDRLAQRLAQLLEQLLLFGRELAWNLHLDHDFEVPAPRRRAVAPESRHAHPFDGEDLTRLRAGGDHEFRLALAIRREGRHHQCMPQSCLRNVDPQLDEQIVVAPLEYLMIADGNHDKEIARRPAVRARLALARDADLRALVNPCRDADFQLARVPYLPAAPALGARLGDRLARSPAGGARRDVDHLPEEGLPPGAHLAHAAAHVAARK